MSHRADLYAWLVLPYVSMAVFVVGHVWRYRRDQFGWNSRSTQLLEHRWLMWGSNLFHYGILGALFGHVLGILVPAALWDKVMDEHTYHQFAGIAGSIAGLIALAGYAILAVRRTGNRRIRYTTSPLDVLVIAVLGILLLTGLGESMGYSLFGSPFSYRQVVSPWFRGLFYDPRPDLMADAPVLFQFHAALPWLLYAVWPFSRLVHVWSYPLQYLGRPLILYRDRYRPARAR